MTLANDSKPLNTTSNFCSFTFLLFMLTIQEQQTPKHRWVMNTYCSFTQTYKLCTALQTPLKAPLLMLCDQDHFNLASYSLRELTVSFSGLVPSRTESLVFGSRTWPPGSAICSTFCSLPFGPKANDGRMYCTCVGVLGGCCVGDC